MAFNLVSSKHPQKKDAVAHLNGDIDRAHSRDKREVATILQQKWSKQYEASRKPPLQKEVALNGTHSRDDLDPILLHDTVASKYAQHTREEFGDDSFAQPNDRHFPRPGEYMAPERMRSLPPEARLYPANEKELTEAIIDHAKGNKSRDPSVHWKAPIGTSSKMTSEERASARKTLPIVQYQSLAFGPNVTIEKKTRPVGNNPKDLTQGQFFDVRNAEGFGFRFARRDDPRKPPIDPDKRTFIGMLEGKKKT